jgi:hypothetical protein
VFGNLEGVDYLSRQFLLKKYLGLSESEITENEILWRKENGEESAANDPSSDLGSIGLRAGDVDGFEATELSDDDFDDGDFDDVTPDTDTDTDTGDTVDEI